MLRRSTDGCKTLVSRLCPLVGHDVAPIKCTARRFGTSHHNPLDFVLREPLLGAVIELGGARALVRRHRLRVFQRAAVGEISGDPGRTERVVADRRHDAGGEGALRTMRQASAWVIG
jgi:hypothetical protein